MFAARIERSRQARIGLLSRVMAAPEDKLVDRILELPTKHAYGPGYVMPVGTLTFFDAISESRHGIPVVA